jgi:hypothetical protein
MFNYYNYIIPEERQSWRSAYEIEIAARKHEKRRIMLMDEEAAWSNPQANQRRGFLALLKAPMRLLSILIG